ncbi:MAG: glycoside hydrolase family 2 protein [Bacteroidetes bacterium]|nr:MAG: glycoside hydrolase family 2 protein [Bacteroidota bacterium]
MQFQSNDLFKSLFLTILFLSVTTSTFSQAGFQMDLTNNWEFQLAESGTIGDEAKALSEKWFPATVPGVIHTDLLDNGLIEDPFWETNEVKLQWIELENWNYRSSFQISKDQLSNQHIEIVFEGLDTYAEVFINGKKVLDAFNMFRTWRSDVKPLLKEGENALLIKFRSPVLENSQKVLDYPAKLPSGNETVEVQVGSFTRKAAYHFGWDWGPRFVGCGVWRPVYLEFWNEARIKDVFCRTTELTEEEANVKINLTIETSEAGQYKMNFNDRSITLPLNEGKNELEYDYKISNPKLWWPNGLGAPNLYNLDIEIFRNKSLAARHSTHFGVRTVKLINEPDEIGTSYYFVVNGHPVFMKGANYIPQDIFLPEVTTDRYKKLIADVKGANMNMLRVWGGGIYENDIFYDLCDKNGILVWQDFMFAGSMYPDFEDFKSNVEAEVIDNVKRLRSHPCIALWCGNNEIEAAWFNWGWQKTYGYSEADSLKIWNTYLGIFREMIPEYIEQLDPLRQYVSTSPLSNWGKSVNFNHSSMHYWGVWHGREPFENFKTNVGRFMAEYGFQSFPAMETIRKFAAESSYSLESPTMANRQKSYIGNGMIKNYTEDWYGKTATFEEFVHYSQKVQAEGIKTAIKAHRMNKPHCMGTLFWQLNDCWPGPSWSCMDYYGTYKPLMDAAANYYKPVAAFMDVNDDTFEIVVVSDKLEPTKGNINLRLVSLENEVLRQWNIAIDVPENGVQKYFSMKINELLQGEKKENLWAELKVTVENDLIFKDVYYFVRPKDLGK